MLWEWGHCAFFWKLAFNADPSLILRIETFKGICQSFVVLRDVSMSPIGRPYFHIYYGGIFCNSLPSIKFWYIDGTLVFNLWIARAQLLHFPLINNSWHCSLILISVYNYNSFPWEHSVFFYTAVYVIILWLTYSNINNSLIHPLYKVYACQATMLY